MRSGISRVYGISALCLMGSADWRLAIPTALWFVSYIFFLHYFVPRMRDLSGTAVNSSSILMGRVVDSYTNILTVKLFSRADATKMPMCAKPSRTIRGNRRPHASDHQIHDHVGRAECSSVGRHVCDRDWCCGREGVLEAGIVAMAVPLAWTIANTAGWVSWEMNRAFENMGVVQEGMQTIAVSDTLTDMPAAREPGRQRRSTAKSALKG